MSSEGSISRGISAEGPLRDPTGSICEGMRRPHTVATVVARGGQGKVLGQVKSVRVGVEVES